MKHTWTEPLRAKTTSQRVADRHRIDLPARLTWKDQRGATRFATVVTRNVSEQGVYVECESAVSIPLFRLVQFQLERDVQGRRPGARTRCATDAYSSAVYRVSPPTSSGTPQGFALRLMVDPRRRQLAEDAIGREDAGDGVEESPN